MFTVASLGVATLCVGFSAPRAEAFRKPVLNPEVFFFPLQIPGVAPATVFTWTSGTTTLTIRFGSSDGPAALVPLQCDVLALTPQDVCAEAWARRASESFWSRLDAIRAVEPAVTGF
ncbi:MAG: hypothetical protein KF733_03430 [Fimbriimonadaceae bacterium]|nr:MAG: hypothetical protein KF733_03430 [Fimbriimonadaceae bacterium]